MLKKILFGSFLLTSAAYSCPGASPTDDPSFCSSFRTAAICYCTSSGLPLGMCQDMNALYNRMLVVFGTVQRACDYQHHTTPRDCMDNWNCYVNGGVDSKGRACSGSQRPC